MKKTIIQWILIKSIYNIMKKTRRFPLLKKCLLGNILLLFLFLFSMAVIAQTKQTTLCNRMFPFLISYDSPENVTNMKHLLHSPAGKEGFIRIKNGRFINNAGVIRLNGINLTGSANFPTKKQADRLAKRLARFGINCVRLHYMDDNYGTFMAEKESGILTNSSDTQRNLDPFQLKRLDYMVYKLKKAGIYVDINLHVGRKWDERDGFIEKDKRPSCDKGIDNFEPRMIELQKEYAKKLMKHVNPYTGLSYSDDPCVSMVEINNENSLIHQYLSGSIDKLPDIYILELQKLWNKWLKEKYKSVESLRQAWSYSVFANNVDIEKGSVPIVKIRDTVPSETLRDFYQFLLDIEQKYWQEMYDYLKNDLKIKSIICGTQLGYSSPFIQAKLDYIDNHAYWCHPSPIDSNWEISNESMVNSMSCIRSLSSQRIYGKPYTISEYNHPFPNQYGAEGQIMLRAYGRLQGWDGVFGYTYNHRKDEEPDKNTYFFSMAGRTDILAHLPACAAIYLRGDANEANSELIGYIDSSAYFNRLISNKKISVGVEAIGYNSLQSLVHKIALDIKDEHHNLSVNDTISLSQKKLVSDTGELIWNTEQPDSGYLIINTPNTKAFTGFVNNRKFSLGNVSLSIGKTRLDWATVSLVSKNASGFGNMGHSTKILLAATGLIENKGMLIKKTSKKRIRLTNWGQGPVYVEGIPASIILPVLPSKTKCYALDYRGEKKKKVPVENDNGNARINIGPQYQTVWYEIDIK
jgi:predicted DNA-binding protein YlxM (UPF0122 family)